MIKYMVNKWRAEVKKNDLDNLDAVELMTDANPTTEFESENLEEAKAFLDKANLAIEKYHNVTTVYYVDCVELVATEYDDDGNIIDSEYIDMRHAEA